jgi:hypothetical protein
MKLSALYKEIAGSIHDGNNFNIETKGYLRDGGSILGGITLNSSEVKWTIDTNMECLGSIICQ